MLLTCKMRCFCVALIGVSSLEMVEARTPPLLTRLIFQTAGVSLRYLISLLIEYKESFNAIGSALPRYHTFLKRRNEYFGGMWIRNTHRLSFT
jgi:hypothetical protein